MSEPTHHDWQLEDQQHESVPRVSYGFALRRRDFFKLLGGGMLVCACSGPMLAQESGAHRGNGDEDLPQNISAWLHIGEDGTVTVYTGKVEMGQNIRTSLTQQVREELRTPRESIHLVMGDTALTPYDMGTFGSRTTPTMGPQLRRVAAAARENLIDMAAKRWGADRSTLQANGGRITDARSNRSISFGELTKGQELVKLVGEDPVLEVPSQWTVAGTSTPKVNGRDFVTGKHKYASDISLPGMMHGKVLRPSAFHATLKSLNTREAEKNPGVKVLHDGNFVGVVAPDVWRASNALRVIEAEWEAPQQTSDATLFQDVRKLTTKESDNPGGPPRITTGSVDQGFSSADKTLKQTYTIAYIQHVPLEPRAAVAQWEDGNLTVWTGTQRPFAVRDELAEAFRLSKNRVHVMVPDTGSAYGGKHTGETAIEAARLAQATGKPVKLVWTREEEFTWAYFRPGGAIDVHSAVQKDGKVVAWQFDNYNSGPAGMKTPYAFRNQHIEFHPADAPLRQGSYRGLAATANHFAREVHIDELAEVVKIDPLEFRRKNLTDSRAQGVLEAAANAFGWGQRKTAPTRGFGIALGSEKGSYVATGAEVEVQGAEVRVKRVVEAFECGAIVNPDGLRNQVAGAIMMGLGGALFEAIHFDNGRILNPHLAEYRVPRFSDMPQVDVVLLDRKDVAPAGAGETPIMALAPAISNAIFAATGTRLRSLPMVPNGLHGKWA